MSNELANTEANELAALQASANDLQKDTDFDEISKIGDYLPRLQLCGANSNLFKEGLIERAHWALVYSKENFKPMGKEPIVFALSWRPIALDTGDETPVTSYDQESEVFKEIQHRATNERDSGCLFGPQFLFYIPQYKACATYLCGSKSSRKVAPELRTMMDNKTVIQLGSRIAKTPKYTWEAPTCQESAEQFDQTVMSPIALKALKKFVEEQKETAQKVTVNPTGTGGEDR